MMMNVMLTVVLMMRDDGQKGEMDPRQVAIRADEDVELRLSSTMTVSAKAKTPSLSAARRSRFFPATSL
jgi:hypothetical protein